MSRTNHKPTTLVNTQKMMTVYKVKNTNSQPCSMPIGEKRIGNK